MDFSELRERYDELHHINVGGQIIPLWKKQEREERNCLIGGIVFLAIVIFVGYAILYAA